jgi:hypothetical protein
VTLKKTGRVEIDISFVGISGETTVFEHMSVDILGQDGMCNKDNDLHNVLINCDQRIKLLHKSDLDFSSVSS